MTLDAADIASAIDAQVPPSGTGCAECDAQNSWWVHLRRCASCGHVGCCDDSINRHATAHYAATGHRVIQSFEPGEDWYWDYQSQEEFEGPGLAPPRNRPDGQSVPGPIERVPLDWQQILAARRG